MPRHTEATVNVLLAEALRRRHPRWRDKIFVEQNDILADAALRPDIIVKQEPGPPIVIETEFGQSSFPAIP